MNKHYEEIMQLSVNCEDLKKIVANWENFSKNRVKILPGVKVVLPDMLWVSKQGMDIPHILSLVSEYLYEESLMDFYGDVKCFEYKLEHRSKENNERMLAEFNDALTEAAGFRNEYKGIIFIDITEWLNHLENRELIGFMSYLSENSDAWHIIFNVDAPEDKLERLEALLSVYFRIEKAVFKLPETPELVVYIENYLGMYGFNLEEDAKSVLTDTVNELRKGKYFDGYRTLEMICADLVYREFSSENFSGYTVTAETARYYDKDGEFVQRTKNNIEKRMQIGFKA